MTIYQEYYTSKWDTSLFSKLYGTSNNQPFYGLFQEFGVNNIGAQMQVIQCFPRIFNIDEANKIRELVSLNEIEDILKNFTKYKIPGQYSMTMKLFLQYFEVIGNDLLNVVEDARVQGKVY